MKDVAFVTCIYSNLSDGSQSRRDRYYTSLKNMLITDAKFVVYCDPTEETAIRNYVGENKNLILIPYDLNSTQYHTVWNLMRGIYKHGNRCMELVHNKINWISDATSVVKADRYYWIDAGLSFFSLFPKRYLRNETHPGFEKYTDISLFTSDWVQRLVNKNTDDKVYCIGMSSVVTLWSQPLPEDLYKGCEDKRAKFHVIGGLLGGTKDNIDWLKTVYEENLRLTIARYRKSKVSDNLPVEELVLNLIVSKHSERFYLDLFDTWYHEDHDSSFDSYKRGTPFYKLFI